MGISFSDDSPEEGRVLVACLQPRKPPDLSRAHFMLQKLAARHGQTNVDGPGSIRIFAFDSSPPYPDGHLAVS
jgi:hypothetical protein